MSNVWERFESIVNQEEVTEAKAQSKPLDAGDYVVTLEKLEATESQQGLPMVKGQFRIVETGKLVFYNQMLQNINNPKMTAVNIAEAVNFIGGLLDTDIEFKSLGHLAGLIEGIEVGEKYEIRVSYGAKDLEQKFPKLKVLSKIYDFSNGTPEDYFGGNQNDEDIPF